MHRSFITLTSVFVLALFIAASPAWGQSTTTLSGTVTDPQGAVIPAATVTITNVATAAARETSTNERGVYQFPQVAPGTYKLRVEATGFKAHLEERVQLLINAPATVNVQLQLGERSETVTVTSQAEVLNTTDATLGNAFSSQQITELPTLLRNPVALLSLQPAVNQTGQVAGEKEDQNNATLDGVDVNDQQSAGAFKSVLPIPLDSVQEFRVTTVGANSNQGRSGGGQVALITKSGSNNWHGSAYEYHRNTVTAANSFFNNSSKVARAPLIRNQYGVSLGGPVIKDRIFFFVNYEGRRDAKSINQQRMVPSESLKQGIFKFQASDGSIQTLSASELKTVDPLGLGSSPALLAMLNKYPAGNAPNLGIDSGLNFSGFRFNAPQPVNYNAYVAKIDFNITKDGRHTAYWRGTLANNSETGTVQTFPGQPDASALLDTSKGFSLAYNATLRPNLINNLTWGFTRQGIESTGTNQDSFSIRYLDQLTADAVRASGRILPVHNLAEDLTWVRGNHTMQMGANLRFIRNNRYAYQPGYYDYQINEGALAGTGTDIFAPINALIQKRSGNPSLTIGSNATAVTAGMQTLLGVISTGVFRFQFDRQGKALPHGAAQVRNFAVNEYEFYWQDAWRVVTAFTLTFGLRYSNSTPPWETNGMQVGPTTSLAKWFAERVLNAQSGKPSNASPLLSFDLNGPANNKPTWFKRDSNNFAPRMAFAWSPRHDGGILGAIFGKGKGVLRGGAGVYYNHFGSSMITDFDQLGSIGMAEERSYPTSYNFATAPRYNGSFPAPVAAPAGAFPITPPVNVAVFNTKFALMDDLVTPYSYALNLSYARELPGGLAFEIGYIGRLSHKGLAQVDIMNPAIILKDPASGQTFIDAMGIMRNLALSGLKDPTKVPAVPYIENMMPKLANALLPGSASANFYAADLQFGNGGLSELDALHIVDRYACLGKFGCNTWFGQQASAMPTWTNAGWAKYHAMTLSLRKRLTKGMGFDFNYTWAHAMDLISKPETGTGFNLALVRDSFNYRSNWGTSDFDIRQQFNSNFIWQLPLGKGQRWGSNATGVLDQLIGGWQLSGIVVCRTALPGSAGTGFNYTTNYWTTGRGIATQSFESSVQTDKNGVPGLFADPAAVAKLFRPQRVGEVGPRNVIRLDGYFDTSLGLSKSFRMPVEGHRLVFRWEMFNAFNNVNFVIPEPNRYSASLEPIVNPAHFGEFTTTTDPRVMQFSLRYAF